MATPPYRFIDRRGYYAGNNDLYQAAKSHPERQPPPDLSHDTHRNMTDVGRRTMMHLGRKLFADFPALEATILEEANLAVGSFLPHYCGGNPIWGKLARSWLVDEWLPICDLRGWPYDGGTYLELHVISELRDGDMGTLLTETSQGYPAIQIIPGHRIRSPFWTASQWQIVRVRLYQDKMWVGGVLIDEGRPFIVEDPIEWDALLRDGVILGPTGNPLAYRVCEDGYGYTVFQDVPARHLFLNYHPKWSDQARGIPGVGSGGWDWQDVQESRRFELMAQKVAAALYLIEHNERGEASSAQRFIQAAIRETDENGVLQTVTPEMQTIKGGIKYFRSGSNSKIDSPSVNRPGMATQQFQQDVMRDALAGAEWSYIFGVDPSKAGGASLRVVVDRVNRVLEKRRKSPGKSFKRIVGYAISKAIKLGILPPDDDWWRWRFLGPGRVTADRKYDSDVDQAEINAGLMTRRKACANRAEHWEDEDAQRLVETTADIQNAQAEAAKLGITWQEYMQYYRPPQASTPKHAPPGGEAEKDRNGDGRGDAEAELEAK